MRWFLTAGSKLLLMVDRPEIVVIPCSSSLRFSSSEVSTKMEEMKPRIMYGILEGQCELRLWLASKNVKVDIADV